MCTAGVVMVSKRISVAFSLGHHRGYKGGGRGGATRSEQSSETHHAGKTAPTPANHRRPMVLNRPLPHVMPI